jgi:hypothetical protein
MNCELCKMKLSEYIDDMLSENERKEIEKHISECESCKAEYEFLKSIISVAGELPDEGLPPEFEKELHKKLTAETGKPKKNNIYTGVKAIGLIAAGFLIVFMINTGLFDVGKNYQRSGDMEMEATVKGTRSNELQDSKDDNKAETAKAKHIEDKLEYTVGNVLSGKENIDFINVNYNRNESEINTAIINDFCDNKRVHAFKATSTGINILTFDGKVDGVPQTYLTNESSYCLLIKTNADIDKNQIQKLNTMVAANAIYNKDFSILNTIIEDKELDIYNIKTDDTVKTLYALKDIFPDFIVEILEVFDKEVYNDSEIIIKLSK